MYCTSSLFRSKFDIGSLFPKIVLILFWFLNSILFAPSHSISTISSLRLCRTFPSLALFLHSSAGDCAFRQSRHFARASAARGRHAARARRPGAVPRDAQVGLSLCQGRRAEAIDRKGDGRRAAAAAAGRNQVPAGAALSRIPDCAKGKNSGRGFGFSSSFRVRLCSPRHAFVSTIATMRLMYIFHF
jgi:hypothetical protein